MEYRYGKNENYEDFSSGRVIYGGAGVPNFPVRLGNEIFGRCLGYKGRKDGLTVYDPCCGGGYLLTVLGFHYPQISKLVGSDVDEGMLSVAAKNFSLLSREGLDRRQAELRELAARYDKESHREALESLERLKGRVRSCHFTYRVLKADCTKPLPQDIAPDIIVTDVPYGNLVAWESTPEASLDRMYCRLAEISDRDTVLAVVMDKKAKPDAGQWRRLEKQTAGKRKFEIYRLKEEACNG